MDIELECGCENPVCEANLLARKGYVHIRHPDGSEEVRWDYFYVDAHRYDSETKESQWVELMYPPEGGRALMWFLILAYFPGIAWIHSKIGSGRYRRNIILWTFGVLWAKIVLERLNDDLDYPPWKDRI